MAIVSRKYSILFFILLLALFLRTYRLESVPPSASIDEVSIGWNAYSILKTGKDEFGTSFPILLRAYDDYRPALYVYLVIPFILLLDVSVIAVRLPSVILSIMSIVGTWILVKELFKQPFLNKSLVSFADVSCFLIAISPWHIYISRLGHEANAGLTGGIFGVLFFYLAIHYKKRYLLFLSSLSFIFALYSYQSQKIIIPVLVITLCLLYLKDLLVIKKTTVPLFFVSCLLLTPLFLQSVSNEGLIRLKGTTVISEDNPYFEMRRKLFIQATREGDIINSVRYHPRLSVPLLLFEQYRSHFSYQFLFEGTALASHKAPYQGLLYSWELPFIILGILMLIRKRSKTAIVLLVWFFSSPLPASFTTGAPHAMRSYTFLPLWQIFSAVGLVTFLNIFGKKQLIVFGFMITFIAIGVGVFAYRYFVLFPQLQSQSFSYALSKAIQYESSLQDTYQRSIYRNVIGTPQFQYPSYMFVLFYQKYDPFLYQNAGGSKTGSFNAERTFGRYKFVNTFTKEQSSDHLYIDSADEQQVISGTIIKTFDYLDNSPGVVMFSNN